jgi:hypothetical protein
MSLPPLPHSVLHAATRLRSPLTRAPVLDPNPCWAPSLGSSDALIWVAEVYDASRAPSGPHLPRSLMSISTTPGSASVDTSPSSFSCPVGYTSPVTGRSAIALRTVPTLPW